MIKSYNITEEDQERFIKLKNNITFLNKGKISSSKILSFILFYAELNINEITDQELTLQIQDYYSKHSSSSGLDSIVEKMFTP
jgi:hypothetical protein